MIPGFHLGRAGGGHLPPLGFENLPHIPKTRIHRAFTGSTVLNLTPHLFGSLNRFLIIIRDDCVNNRIDLCNSVNEGLYN